MIRFSCVALLFLLSQCRSVKHDLQGCNVEKFVQKKITSNQLEFNKTKSYVIAVDNSTYTDGLTRYLIIDVNTCSIAYEGVFRAGHIKWLNNDQIEILDLPGVLLEDRNDLSIFKKIISVSSNPLK